MFQNISCITQALKDPSLHVSVFSNSYLTKNTYVHNPDSFSTSANYCLQNRNGVVMDNIKKTRHCSLSMYSGSPKKDLQSHSSSVHEKERPFQCSLCSHSALPKRDLIRHVSAVHNNEKPLKYCICRFSAACKERRISQQWYKRISYKRISQ